MSWDGTVVEDVGPPRAKPTGGSKPQAASSPVTSKPVETKPVSSPTETQTPVSQKFDAQPSAALAVTKTESKERRLCALYAYEQTEEGELTFDEGAVILVIQENESGWWRGRLESGAEGLFPSNFMMSEAESLEAMAQKANEVKSNEKQVAAPVIVEPVPVAVPVVSLFQSPLKPVKTVE